VTLPRARKLTEHYRTLVTASATTSADAKYGTRATPKVTLEALKKKGWRPPAVAVPPAASPGGKSGVTWKAAAERAARSGYLTSPRSLHVCMEAGVDPATLLERDLASFEEKGVSLELQESAHAHHLEVRAKTLARLLAARAALPATFQPPSVGVDPLSKSFKMSSAPGENSADAEMRARQAEEEAKRAKQREKLEANRLAAEAATQKLQREFAEKTTRTEARARVVSKKQQEAERARTAEQVRRTAEQTRLAASYEADERAAALRRVDEETAARRAAARAAALEAKAEASRRAESAARVAARAAKTAAIRARKEAHTEALRVHLEARDAKLRKFETALRLERDAARTPRGPDAAGGAARKPSVSRNLEARASEEARRKQDLVRERLRRDARAMSARLSDADLEARAARDAAAAEKRRRAEETRESADSARAAAHERAEAARAAHLAALEKSRASQAERTRFERALKQSERTQRVQNLSRAREVEKARTTRKLETDAARASAAAATRAKIAETRQLENCRVALAKSTRQQREEEQMRKETRARWLKSQEPDLELEARIAAEAEAKARAAAEAKEAERRAAAARVKAKHARSASQVSALSQVAGSRAHSTAGSARGGGAVTNDDADAENEDDADGEEARGEEKGGETNDGGEDDAVGGDAAPASVAAFSGTEAFVEAPDLPIDGEDAEEAPAAVDEPEAADVEDEDVLVA